jgi:hypothetical protein
MTSQHTTITIPRGQNIGKAIKDYFITKTLYKYIDFTSILVKRDTVNKVNIAEVNYKFISN